MLFQLQSKLFKLLRIDSLRCFCHQVRCIFYLRERDHVTDAVLFCHQHNQTVKTVSKSCVWRHTVFKCIQKESELLLCLFRCESKYFKHFTLDLLVEDTDTSASDLVTIQNDVICFPFP